MRKLNYCECMRVQSQSSQVGTFKNIYNRICDQISLDLFSPTYIHQAQEICMIITEIMLLPDDTEIQIAGKKMNISLVRNVYSFLEYDHVAMVIDNFRQIRYKINHKKTYLRTALYNSVFELAAAICNDVNTES